MASSRRGGIKNTHGEHHHEWSFYATLDPAEELRFLHARIAELERLQTTASSSNESVSSPQNEMNEAGETYDDNDQMEEGPTSGLFASVDQLKQFCEKLSKMELEDIRQFCLATNLENRALHAELKHQKLLTQHKALQTKVTKMAAELEQQQQKNAELKQQRDDDLLKLFLICPQKLEQCRLPFGFACHSTGGLSRCLPPRRVYVPVRAQFAVPPDHYGIFYFELKIEKMTDRCCFGLAPLSMLLNGDENGGYWYNCDGTFWGHNVRGCQFFDKRLPYVTNKDKCSFVVGDVVGCGLNLATFQIIYTRNGRRLDTVGLWVRPYSLYPFVALKGARDRVKANFGPNFLYDLDEEFFK